MPSSIAVATCADHDQARASHEEFLQSTSNRYWWPVFENDATQLLGGRCRKCMSDIALEVPLLPIEAS